MAKYYGMAVTVKEFKSFAKDSTVIYQLTTDSNKSIGFMSAGKLVYDGEGHLNDRIKITSSKIVDLQKFDKYYVAK